MVHSAQMRPKTPKSVVPFYHLLRPGLSCSNVGALFRYPPCESLSRRSGYAASRILFALSGAGIEIYPVDSVIQLLNT